MAQVDEDITNLLRQPLPPGEHGLTAQVIGTGPTVRYSAMPEVFETLMYTARRELFITTPYYVPDESMQAALCASARRGVSTTVIFPARNDSWIVGAASRSYYSELLAAGVRIAEYEGGLLHTKSLTLDGEVTLIGSANMDRRSFELNYENNIQFYDPALTAAQSPVLDSTEGRCAESDRGHTGAQASSDSRPSISIGVRPISSPRFFGRPKNLHSKEINLCDHLT